MSAALAFAVVAFAHAGFQVTVTVLVYPALAEVDPARWAEAHARHSRRITPVVGVLYAGLVAAGAWWVVVGPGPWGWCAVLASVVAVLLTAALAAPLHGRLGSGDPEQRSARTQRLLAVDRLRCAAALVAASAALVAVAR